MDTSKKYRQIKELDPLIDGALDKLLAKKPAYMELAKEIINLPQGENKDTQARITRIVRTVLECQKYGASAYFAQHPTAMSEMLANQLTHPIDASNYPDLKPAQLRILKELQGSWKRTLNPLLAERTCVYGKEKLATQGLTHMVREWCESHHSSFQKCMQSLELLSYFKAVIHRLSDMNSNKKAQASLKILLGSTESENYADIVSEHLPIVAEHFTAKEKAVNEQSIRDLNEAIGDVFHHMWAIPKDSTLAIIHMHHRLQELVKTPLYGAAYIMESREK